MKKPELPKPLKKRIDAVTDEAIAEALIAKKGLQYLAAEVLGLEPSRVCQRIQESPYLQMITKNALERRLDVAEHSLAEMTERKDLGAICFLLKTKGKDRGYTETQNVALTPETFDGFERTMKQMERLQSSLNKDKISSNADAKS